ncbi:MAG: hypothetical protein ACLVHU_00260 [Bifidobacterium adolescentis]
MTRGKNRRLRLIPSHLPLIRDKLVEYERVALKEELAAGGWNSPQMLDYYDMSRRGLNGKAGDGLQDYLGKED